jgi:putative acetyltransferase
VHLSAFEGDDEVAFVDSLRASPSFVPELSMVAEFRGRIVGHILLTPVQLQKSDGEIGILALAPMAVVPSQSHRGIGSALVEAVIEKAKSLGYKAVVVAGHPDYYLRLGFKRATDFDVHCSLPVASSHITVMELEQEVLSGGGKVIYPAQFARIY